MGLQKGSINKLLKVRKLQCSKLLLFVLQQPLASIKSNQGQVRLCLNPMLKQFELGLHCLVSIVQMQ